MPRLHAVFLLLAACGDPSGPAEDPDARAPEPRDLADASTEPDAVASLDAVWQDAGAPDAEAPIGQSDASAPRDAGSSDTGARPMGVPTLAVNVITGATADERLMIAGAVELANRTMATECFRAFVLAAAWTETEGLSQAQIYDQLATNPVSVDLEIFTGSWYQNHVTHTIGYENEPGKVHVNRYFVDTVYEAADNLVHEAEGHSQGFSHYGVKSTSVPYGLNDAFEACTP